MHFVTMWLAFNGGHILPKCPWDQAILHGKRQAICFFRSLRYLTLETFSLCTVNICQKARKCNISLFCHVMRPYWNFNVVLMQLNVRFLLITRFQNFETKLTRWLTKHITSCLSNRLLIIRVLWRFFPTIKNSI